MLGPILLRLNDAATVYVPRVSKQPVDGDRQTLRDVENFPATLQRQIRRRLTDDARRTRARTYQVWHKQSTDGGPAGKYLVDAGGTPVYLVDPGINGMHHARARRHRGARSSTRRRRR